MSNTATAIFAINPEKLSDFIAEEWGEAPNFADGNIAKNIAALVDDVWLYYAVDVLAKDAPEALSFGCYAIDDDEDSAVLLTLRCGSPESFIQVASYSLETKHPVGADDQVAVEVVLERIIEHVSDLYPALLDLLAGREQRLAS